MLWRQNEAVGIGEVDDLYQGAVLYMAALFFLLLLLLWRLLFFLKLPQLLQVTRYIAAIKFNRGYFNK